MSLKLVAAFSLFCTISTAQIISEIKVINGRPTMLINGVESVPIQYALTDVPGGRWSFEEIPQYNIELFCKSGVTQIQLDIFLDHIWKEDGSFDLTIAKKQVQGAIQVCPQAKIFFRFHVNPPKWWQAKYPEENVVYEGGEYSDDINYGVRRILDGDARPTRRYSLASQKWKTESGNALKRFCKEFSETVEGNYLAGIQAAGGVYGEWHYWGFNSTEPDQSIPMTLHFQKWVKSKYQTEKNLKKAWNDPKITFEKIKVPDLAARSKVSDGIFRNPITDRYVIDYYQCQHEMVADNILYFCKIVKENWPRPIITGAFYGYFFSVFGRQAAGGHLALQKLLKSPYIDYLSGPQAYYPDVKDIGQTYKSRSLIESLRLNGKLWLDEYDQQPVRIFPFKDGSTDQRPKFDSVMRNNAAEYTRSILSTLSYGMGLWHYDFGPGTQVVESRSEYSTQSGNNNGWWEHPIYQNALKPITTLTTAALQKPYQSASDVLLVYDTDVFYHLKSVQGQDPVTHPLIDWLSTYCRYSGISYAPIHLDDLEKVDLKNYKTIIFGNTFKLTSLQRKYIKEKVSAEGRNVVFFYAPGYTDGNTNQLSFISDVLGVEMKKHYDESIQSIDPIPNLKALGNLAPWGETTPIFYTDDKSVEVLGTYTDGKIGWFSKKTPSGGEIMFIGMPTTSKSLIKYIFRKLNNHFYTENQGITYAGNNWLVFHTATGGDVRFIMPDKREKYLSLPIGSNTLVIDAVTGEILFQLVK